MTVGFSYSTTVGTASHLRRPPRTTSARTTSASSSTAANSAAIYTAVKQFMQLPCGTTPAHVRIPRVPVAETDANPLDARLPFGAAQPKASTPASPIAVHHQPERFAAYGALAHH
ncbi:hypothetical protein MPSD_43920 [Mycobacterium pseudoshottsii JCM 15466]|nr:hypothetical protein MPSD_43920 [Mycobacterium pseudoshottsii JCM 15466]